MHSSALLLKFLIMGWLRYKYLTAVCNLHGENSISDYLGIVSIYIIKLSNMSFVLVCNQMQDWPDVVLPITVSIVMSGGYEDDVDNSEDVIYTGQGGNNLTGDRRQIKDQKMTKGNLALKVCKLIYGLFSFFNPYYRSKPFLFDHSIIALDLFC